MAVRLRLLRTNSLKEGAMWHIYWKPELWNQQRRPLLGNGSATTSIARQQLHNMQ
jgi:hypothetical protein